MHLIRAFKGLTNSDQTCAMKGKKVTSFTFLANCNSDMNHLRLIFVV